MLSYQVETSEGCFVWGAPTLRTGAVIRIWKSTVGIFAFIARNGAKCVPMYSKYLGTDTNQRISTLTLDGDIPPGRVDGHGFEL